MAYPKGYLTKSTSNVVVHVVVGLDKNHTGCSRSTWRASTVDQQCTGGSKAWPTWCATKDGLRVSGLTWPRQRQQGQRGSQLVLEGSPNGQSSSRGQRRRIWRAGQTTGMAETRRTRSLGLGPSRRRAREGAVRRATGHDRLLEGIERGRGGSGESAGCG